MHLLVRLGLRGSSQSTVGTQPLRGRWRSVSKKKLSVQRRFGGSTPQEKAAGQQKLLRPLIMAKSKKDVDQPAPSWEIVRAVKIEGGFATCVCGSKIKLKPEGPILKYGKREFLPYLIGVICRKCNREVRLDDERIEISQTLRQALRKPPISRKRPRQTPAKK